MSKTAEARKTAAGWSAIVDGHTVARSLISEAVALQWAQAVAGRDEYARQAQLRSDLAAEIMAHPDEYADLPEEAFS